MRSKRLLTAAITLSVVQLLKILDALGIMSNTYDLMDLGVNAAGVALALWLDTVTSA
jgi:hypothetical protein